MILDQQPTKTKRSGVSVAMIIELLLVVATVGSLLLRDGLSDIRFQPLCLYSSLALIIWYFFTYYWISKPRVRNARKVIFTIMYGVVFAFLMTTFTALANFITWIVEFSLLSAVLLGMVVALDLSLGLRTSPVAKKGTFMRMGIFLVLIVTFYLIPMEKRVQLTFRKYPGFIAFYEIKRDEKPFDEVYYEYVHSFTMIRE